MLEYQLRQARPELDGRLVLILSLRGVLLVADLVAPAAFLGATPVHKVLRSVIE